MFLDGVKTLEQNFFLQSVNMSSGQSFPASSKTTRPNPIEHRFYVRLGTAAARQRAAGA